MSSDMGMRAVGGPDSALPPVGVSQTTSGGASAHPVSIDEQKPLPLSSSHHAEERVQSSQRILETAIGSSDNMLIATAKASGLRTAAGWKMVGAIIGAKLYALCAGVLFAALSPGVLLIALCRGGINAVWNKLLDDSDTGFCKAFSETFVKFGAMLKTPADRLSEYSGKCARIAYASDPAKASRIEKLSKQADTIFFIGGAVAAAAAAGPYAPMIALAIASLAASSTAGFGAAAGGYIALGVFLPLLIAQDRG